MPPPRLFYRVDLLNYVGLLGGDFSKDADTNIQKRQKPLAIYREDIQTKIIDNDNNDHSGSGQLDLSEIPETSRPLVLQAVAQCDREQQQDIIDLTALAIKEKRITKNAERYARGLAKITLAGGLDKTALPSYRAGITYKKDLAKKITQVTNKSILPDPAALATGTMMLDKIRKKRSSNQMGAQK